MTRMTASVVLGILLTAGTSFTAMAALENPGFETGDFSGWNLAVNAPGDAYVTPESYEMVWDFVNNIPVLPGNPYHAAEGANFAVLIAGNPDVLTFIWQSVHLNAGQTLAGMATFKAYDSSLYDDWAAVRIYSDGSFAAEYKIAEPWYRDVISVGSYGSSPWEYWSWQAQADGDYYLWYGVANRVDSLNQSQAGFDAVPVPPSLLFLGTGLLAVFLIGKRRLLLHFNRQVPFRP